MVYGMKKRIGNIVTGMTEDFTQKSRVAYSLQVFINTEVLIFGHHNFADKYSNATHISLRKHAHVIYRFPKL